MQKLIAIPIARYNNLIQKENSKSGLKQAVDATIKNLENQELLARQRYYDEANEEMPENHNKVLGQTAVTALPPPPLQKVREYKRKRFTEAELDTFFGTKTRKTKKSVVKKPEIKKEVKQKPTNPAIITKTVQKFNLFDRAAFHRKSKK